MEDDHSFLDLGILLPRSSTSQGSRNPTFGSAHQTILVTWISLNRILKSYECIYQIANLVGLASIFLSYLLFSYSDVHVFQLCVYKIRKSRPYQDHCVPSAAKAQVGLPPRKMRDTDGEGGGKKIARFFQQTVRHCEKFQLNSLHN